MKVCHVVASLDPKDGGLPRVVLELAKAQSKLGSKVTIIFGLNTKRKRASDKFCRGVLDKSGVKLVPIEGGLIKQLISRQVCVQLEREESSPEVIHLHGIWEIMLLKAGQWAVDKGIPVVITPHGMLDPEYSLKQKRVLKKWLLVFLKKSLLEKAAYIQALNETEYRGITKLG